MQRKACQFGCRHSETGAILLDESLSLYANGPLAAELEQAAYTLDSTTIDLCLSLFPWVASRRHKGAVKLHTLLTLQGHFPTVVMIAMGP